MKISWLTSTAANAFEGLWADGPLRYAAKDRGAGEEVDRGPGDD